MRCRGTPVPAAAILAVLFAAGSPTGASAQGITAEGFSAIDARTPVQPGRQPSQLLPATGGTFHETVRFPRMQRQRRSRPYGLAQRVTAVVVMGFAGFWIGGKFGATLEGNCACDDPGLRGFVIGAPIGVAAGATLGIVLTR
jgi:hypothetical protein